MAVTNTTIGNLYFNLKGEYDNTQGYIVDDVVTYRNKDYICIVDAVAGAYPNANPSNWKLFRDSFNYVGEYDNTNGTPYFKGDVVFVKNIPIANQKTELDQDIRTSATYLAVADVTADGTVASQPWNNNSNWHKISSEHDFDDSTIVNNNVTTNVGETAVYTGKENECIHLVNYNGGMVFDNNPYYQKGDNYARGQFVDWNAFIDGNGNVKSNGSNSNGQSGFNRGTMFILSSIPFAFLDWYRSTDNGGTGVHSTPDGKEPKCIQLIGGYQTGVAVFNNGEIYHWGYGGHGQNGDASTSTRKYSVRCGGSYQNVYLATNTSVHTLRDTRIVRAWVTNSHGYDNSAHSVYALDEDGELWSWGYNGYGQLGHADGSNRNQPTKLDKATRFGNSKVVAFWTMGTQYASCYAVTEDGKFWVWGYNGYGQLGIGDTSNRNVPTEITATVFDSANAGTITKIQADEYGSYGRAAILTSKKRIYTTGYNSYGWNMSGNTNQQNAWTQVTYGPGAGPLGTAENMWFVGNGQYQSFFVYDGTKLESIGNNNNYQLGIGNSSNQTSLSECQVDIHGQLTSITNVKWVGGMSQGNYHNTWVLTEDGNVFHTGRNNFGCGSHGYESSYSNDQQWHNGIEHRALNGWFQMPSLPAGMQGNVDQIMPKGYNTSIYWGCAFKDKNNRYYYAGYAGSGMNAHYEDWRNATSGAYNNNTADIIPIG